MHLLDFLPANPRRTSATRKNRRFRPKVRVFYHNLTLSVKGGNGEGKYGIM